MIYLAEMKGTAEMCGLVGRCKPDAALGSCVLPQLTRDAGACESAPHSMLACGARACSWALSVRQATPKLGLLSLGCLHAACSRLGLALSAGLRCMYWQQRLSFLCTCTNQRHGCARHQDRVGWAVTADTVSASCPSWITSLPSNLARARQPPCGQHSWSTATLKPRCQQQRTESAPLLPAARTRRVRHWWLCCLPT